MRGGDLVREARLRAGITQAELASRAGTTQSAIARLETGKITPSWDYVTRLVRLAGFEAEIRLVPKSDDCQLAEESLRLSADERVRRLTRTVEFILAGREALKKSRG